MYEIISITDFEDNEKPMPKSKYGTFLYTPKVGQPLCFNYDNKNKTIMITTPIKDIDIEYRQTYLSTIRYYKITTKNSIYYLKEY